jgi:hypothetical protein
MARAIGIGAVFEHAVDGEAEVIDEHGPIEIGVEEQLVPKRVDIGFDGLLDGVPHAASSAATTRMNRSGLQTRSINYLVV